MNLTENWIICFLIALLLMGFAFFARADQGSWFAPGAFFCLLWCCYLFAPLVFLPGEYIWPGAVIAIVLATFAVYVGSLMNFGRLFSLAQLPYLSSCANEFEGGSKRRIRLPGLAWLTVIGSALGCGAVWVAASSEGFSLGDLFSPDSIMTMGYLFSVARYSQDYRPPQVVQFLTLFMYTAALLGGVLFLQAQNKRESLLAFVPFLPSLFFAIIFTTRSSLLYQGVLWLSSCIATAVYVHGFRASLFTKRFCFFVLLLAPLLFTVFVVALVIRSGEEFDSFQFRLLLIDVGGHMVAFSTWLKSSWYTDLTPSYGVFSFAGAFEMLGVTNRGVGGIYEELVEVGSERGFGDIYNVTNIYTAFRGLIHDVTLPLAPLFLFLVGFLAGKAYMRVSAGSVATLPALSAFYSFALWSPIISFTIYNTLLGAYCLFFTYTILVTAGKLIFPFLRPALRYR